jgi:hypothetical protein
MTLISAVQFFFRNLMSETARTGNTAADANSFPTNPAIDGATASMLPPDTVILACDTARSNISEGSRFRFGSES